MGCNEAEGGSRQQQQLWQYQATVDRAGRRSLTSLTETEEAAGRVHMLVAYGTLYIVLYDRSASPAKKFLAAVGALCRGPYAGGRTPYGVGRWPVCDTSILVSFDCGRVQTVRYAEVYCAMQVAQKRGRQVGSID
jgi:hypothetical protein